MARQRLRPELSNEAGYRHKRRRAYELALPAGDLFDALLEWAEDVRMARDAVANAATLDELKAALQPVVSLPQGLDDAVAKALAIKRRFPKSEGGPPGP